MAQHLCPIQASLLKERIMLVDRSDNILGSATKEEAHLLKNIEEKGMLHRAFSLFLFNSDNKLMMQQRSNEKITFPNLYTNTCCSHPLHTIPMEQDPISGIKYAAIRRIEDELGIVDIKFEDIKLMTRIIYYGESSSDWGEHELDHVLIVKKDVKFKANPNEVRNVYFLGKDELDEFLKNDNHFPVTPWFKIIANSKVMLKKWWDNIDNVEQHADGKIHEFSFPTQYT